MFDVEGVSTIADDNSGGNASEGVLQFGVGGIQGSRGGNGSHWYVQGVKELLDDALEFYYDEKSHTLYFQPNSTDGAPSGTRLAAPVLQQLLAVRGSQTAPVRDVIIRGVTFRDAAPTFLEPHSVPSGGDWALSRTAALFAEGTLGLQVFDCDFERNDGNALMLSGYHRGAAVTDSHFAYTGGTAIAAWGRTDELSDGGIHGYDATPGDIPQGTRIEGNIMRESGIWEKQSSCFFQAKTAGSILLRNLCYNLPRAGFNFNVRVVCCSLC